MKSDSLRVLLCDDQLIVGVALRQMLEDCPNLSFEHVQTGAEILKKIETFKPTVLLQDLVLENQSGFDVVKLVRSEARYQDLPIVVLSTTEDPKVKYDAFSAGANDYIVKFPEKFELMGRISYHSKAYLNAKEKEEAQRLLAQRSRLESLGTLSAGVAHEINSPLQYVSSNLEYVLNSLESLGSFQDKEDVIGAIRDCIKGANVISTIVKAMNVFTSSGNQEYSENRLIEILNSVRVLSAKEWQDHADFEIDNIDPDLRVNCVASAVLQAILSLVMNSAQGTKTVALNRSPKIKISAFKEGDGTSIVVEDNGEGIAEEIKDRIFDPFFTTRDVGEGRGQGLTTARSIIEDLHGGKLTFESKVNEGTKFSVLLP